MTAQETIKKPLDEAQILEVQAIAWAKGLSLEDFPFGEDAGPFMLNGMTTRSSGLAGDIARKVALAIEHKHLINVVPYGNELVLMAKLKENGHG